MRGIVLLLAAGEGTRLGSDGPKAFYELDGKTLLKRSLDAIARAQLVDACVVALRKGFAIDGARSNVIVVSGGTTRQESAWLALGAAPAAEAVLVHDAARALAPPSLFDAVLRELDECEAVIPAIPLRDTVKEIESDHVAATLDRSRLALVQTPQGFRTNVYRRAHEEARDAGFIGTDDAALVERTGVKIRVIPGDDRNIKITTMHDVHVAEALLHAER